ncbi:hypothetical protein [Saccharopolyspora oryzae]|uniref:Uncharacterized protein n=1 Tax=Saccharopolyspora oryzae TaxID=2997343 RepID=A0ABT4UU13_9PSEU|nr:hypothetical protein [Saccharopolyspora oryzae]MDA3625214.1 hypothetical protein [Saccharopolyspora oryzae]
MIEVGEPQVRRDAPAHLRGVPQGNSVGNYERQPGHRPDGTSTARRSTGICAGRRDPILSSMPNLSPA